MSMPKFPEESTNITCDQAINMLLGSIAMEELALSHIMNAEGEKLQYVLGTLPGSPCRCSTPKEVLAVNRSISDLLDKVAYQQVLLKGKLQQVLDAREQCCPDGPVCPPQPVGACIWVAEKKKPWVCGCPLPWSRGGEGCDAICWQGCASASIHLCAQSTYLVCFSFRLTVKEPGPVRLTLQAVRGCMAEEILDCASCAEKPGQTIHLSGCTVLSPSGCQPTPSPIQFVLKTPGCVQLEQGVLHLVTM